MKFARSRVSAACSRAQGSISRKHGFLRLPRPSGYSRSYTIMFRQAAYVALLCIPVDADHVLVRRDVHTAGNF
jgi:hypothetical protein